MTHTDKGKGRALLVTAAVLWGLAGVCVKSIEWGTMSIVAARSFLSFIVLMCCKRSFLIRFTKSNILAGLAMTATGMLYVQGIKMTTAGTAIVLQYVAPILVFLYAIFFMHRKPKLREGLITVAVFGGIVLSFADSLDATHVWGNILSFASGFTFAAQIVLCGREDTDSNDALLISMIFSFVIAMPFVFAEGMPKMDAKNIIWVFVMGLFQYGLANAAFAAGIHKVEAVEASLLMTIEPVFNPIPVAVFCGEMMGPKALVGAFIVIVFVTLYALLPALESRRKGVN